MKSKFYEPKSIWKLFYVSKRFYVNASVLNAVSSLIMFVSVYKQTSIWISRNQTTVHIYVHKAINFTHWVIFDSVYDYLYWKSSRWPVRITPIELEIKLRRALNEGSVWLRAGRLLLSSHYKERERWRGREIKSENERPREPLIREHAGPYSSFWTLQVNSVSKDSMGRNKQAAGNKRSTGQRCRWRVRCA